MHKIVQCKTVSMRVCDYWQDAFIFYLQGKLLKQQSSEDMLEEGSGNPDWSRARLKDSGKSRPIVYMYIPGPTIGCTIL